MSAIIKCDFKAGEILYTIGLNMQCRKVVVRCKFVDLHHDGRVVTESDGIKVIGGCPGEYFKSRKDAVNSII